MSTNLEIKPKRGRKKKVVESENTITEPQVAPVSNKTEYTQEQLDFIEADIN